VGSSKSKQAKTLIKNTIEVTQAFNEGLSQEAHHLLLQAADYPTWNSDQGVHMVPTFGTTQPFMPMYAPYLQTDDNPPDV